MPTIIGYAPGSITFVNNPGPDESVTLDSGFVPGDRLTFDITDDDGNLDGDSSNNEVGNDPTQTAVVTDEDGNTVASGTIYAEIAYILENPSGGSITVYALEIGGVPVGFITSEPLEPGVTYVANDVNVNNGNAQPYTDFVDVPCFTPGTMIKTPRGEIAVEKLKVGDVVLTLDNGPQTIRWIGERQLSIADLTCNRHFQPVVITKDALGENVPDRDLTVSPEHRMLISSPRLQILFDKAAALIPARGLRNGTTIRSVTVSEQVSYFHILFDQHEIIFANGAPAESLHVDDRALSLSQEAARDEILALFPELKGRATPFRPLAYPQLKSLEANLL